MKNIKPFQLQELVKMENKSQKPYLTDNSLLVVQDLSQAHYQILLVNLLKKLIKLNANMGIIIKKCETCRIKYKDWDYCLEYINVKDDLIEYKCLCYNKNYQRGLMKT